MWNSLYVDFEYGCGILLFVFILCSSYYRSYTRGFITHQRLYHTSDACYHANIQIAPGVLINMCVHLTGPLSKYLQLYEYYFCTMLFCFECIVSYPSVRPSVRPFVSRSHCQRQLIDFAQFRLLKRKTVKFN